MKAVGDQWSGHRGRLILASKPCPRASKQTLRNPFHYFLHHFHVSLHYLRLRPVDRLLPQNCFILQQGGWGDPRSGRVRSGPRFYPTNRTYEPKTRVEARVFYVGLKRPAIPTLYVSPQLPTRSLESENDNFSWLPVRQVEHQVNKIRSLTLCIV